MTLIVEDGTGMRGADSYISAEDATAYLSSMGMTTWSQLDLANQEAALRRATMYMKQTYRQRWAGTRVSNQQSLDWPRYGVPVLDGPGGLRTRTDYIAWNVVPDDVRHACADLALKAAAGPLTDDLVQGVKSKKIGPILIEYDTTTSRTKSYPAVDRMLEPYLQNGSGSLKIGRC